jgi:transcriptional regulator with XRE-family HTH domain
VTPAEKGQPDPPEGHRDRLVAIGKAIRLRRVELDMKRTQLAELAGLSYAYVAEIENGTKQASSKALWALGHALDLEPHELLALAALVGSSDRGPGTPARESAVSSHLRRLGVASAWMRELPAGCLIDALGSSRAVMVEPPPSPEDASVQGPPSPEAPAASAGGGRRASWFHLAPGAASTGADPGDAGEAASEPAGAPDLPDVLARLEVALDGVPEERAELALMLALDECRTRRIVREELERRTEH